jgi:PPOX class probable F420-dependent enzyme
MSADEIAAMLDEIRSLQVATINADGTPHLVAMWFVTDHGDTPVFWTYGKSQKVVNLRRDPRITVLVEDGDTYETLRGVSIVGRAELIEDRDEVFALGERIFEKYWGPITDDSVREGVHAMGAKRVGVVVRPDTITSWDHSKLGGVY